MFILRHYGQDNQGRKTTVNYFSTRASAGAANLPPPIGGRAGERGSPEAHAAAEASTTTVKTIITGPGSPRTQLAADDSAANALNAFEGVELDAEAQAEIYRSLEACAERRRALEEDPENDPDRYFIGEAETNGYLGELESGVEDDWVAYRPEGEHRWENLGEGGQAEKIDEVLAGIAERRAAMTREQIAAEEAEHQAEVRRMREERALPPPVPSEVEGPAPEPDPDSPMLDWRNWTDGGYAPAEDPAGGEEGEDATPSPVRGCVPSGERAHGWGEVMADVPISPRTGKPLKRYKKRTRKPGFERVPAEAGDVKYETRKAEAINEVEAERREAAVAEAGRRRTSRCG